MQKLQLQSLSFCLLLLNLLRSSETEEIEKIGECTSILYKRIYIAQAKILKDTIYKKKQYFTFKDDLRGLSIPGK